MIVYRITKSRYANQLIASGGAARWNSRGKFVIYTAASRALACLENVVHRSGEGLQDDFRVMVIDVPDTLQIERIMLEQLPTDWYEYKQYFQCQQLGDQWLLEHKAAVLQVPSAIIPHESNYLLNPAHSDFQKIRLLKIEPFSFDPRINM